MKYVTPETEIMEFDATNICCTLGVSGPENNNGWGGNTPEDWGTTVEGGE